MRIDRILINNLRNHNLTDFKVSKGINTFFGLNGAGKTTVLEGVSLSALTKSFLPVLDNSLLKTGEETFSIHIEAETDLLTPYKIRIEYKSGLKKNISGSIGENLLPKDIIGEIPVVILSPDYKSITFGTPGNRRQFVDRILSQISKSYMQDILELKKCLRQRNILLKSFKSAGKINTELLQPWTNQLINTSSEIITKRYLFISEFKEIFKNYYETISSGKELVDLIYSPDSIELKDTIDKTSVKETLLRKADKLQRNEFIRGTTLFGPQKDDIIININSSLAKDHASQGQHKSLLISLKFAEYIYILEKRRETPVFLMDDIFSELDDERTKTVLDMVLDAECQTFITITNPRKIRQFTAGREAYYFLVENGMVSRNDL